MDDISIGTLHGGYVFEVSLNQPERDHVVISKYGGSTGEILIEQVSVPLEIAEEFAMDIFRVQVLHEADDRGMLDHG